MSREFEPAARLLRDIQGYRQLRLRSYRIPQKIAGRPALEIIGAFMQDDAYDTWFLLDGEDLPSGYDDSKSTVNDTPRHGPFDQSRMDVSLYTPVALEEAKEHLLHLTARAQTKEQYPYQPRGFFEGPHYTAGSETVEELFGALDADSSEAYRLEAGAWDERYRHELAVQDEFTEYLVIDRSTGLLHMVVVSAA
ncbi:MAG: hypothetical protein IAE99_12745 [Rhodothermales bacterium]|nr:hypothetical protein [Rhodothermales bacterium]